jgi:hypothetical protein
VSTARLVGMTGHAGLPPPTVELVTAALRDTLGAYVPNLVGVTMLGPGADQLFARVVLSLGGTLHVVQPTTGSQYRDGFTDPDAQRGYDELYGQASHVQVLAHTESTEQAHMDGGKAVVDRSSVLVAVWDGQPSRGLGGTGDVVAYARQRGVPVTVVWPEGATRD